MTRHGRVIALLLAAVACLLSANPRAQEAPRRLTPWPDEIVHAFRGLPVQDGGRIKPFDTVAQFLMLRINEVRKKRLPDDRSQFGAIAGTVLGPTEWGMDVLLYPEQADQYPVFVVTDADALHHVGLGEIARKKRDRYSFAELEPGLTRLDGLWREYARIDERDRERLQNQIVYLAQDLAAYQGLRQAFAAARAHFHVGESQILKAAYSDAESVRYSEALRHVDKVFLAYRALVGSGSALEGEKKTEADAVSAFLHRLQAVSSSGSALIWLPPADQREEAWLDQSGVFGEILEEGAEKHESQLQALAMLERVVDATPLGPESTGDALLPFVRHVREMAFSRGEAAKVDMEVAYYETGLLDKGFYAFVLALLGAVVVWLRPRWKVPYVATWVLTAGGTLFVIGGIVFRCILLGRPPVLNLYDTILFITATAALIGIFIEAVNRMRIALTVTAVFGFIGLLIAGKYEVLKAEDTMHQLQAVLDTNFWLATHVTTVTFGYSAGLLAGLLGAVFLVGQLFAHARGWSPNSAFFRAIAKMVYGVICFGVLLSTIGTILGGIWANYSWGRFWGWDPKENGALMIVLWELAILHARLGGLIRNWGLCFAAVLGNIIVAFSWWGVNVMGVGLHSYGFTSGISKALWIFYGSQMLVMLLGAIAWWLQAAAAKPAEQTGSDSVPAESTT